MDRKVILHLGAHKTATTYLQNTLWKNKSKLTENKIAYIPLNLMRSGITACIVKNDSTPQQFYDLVKSNLELNDYETLIISDENIIGGINDILTNKSIAPKIKLRLDKIVQAFGKDHSIFCYFAVREYASYYASIYCECLRHLNRYETFDTFIEGFDYLQFSWLNIINEFTNFIDADKINIYSFEYFIENEQTIFKALTNGRIDNFIEYSETSGSRKTFRHKTIELLDHLSLRFNNQMLKNLINPVDKAMLSINRNRKFIPFSESELNYFSNKYNKDLEEIKNLDIKYYI